MMTWEASQLSTAKFSIIETLHNGSPTYALGYGKRVSVIRLTWQYASKPSVTNAIQDGEEQAGAPA